MSVNIPYGAAVADVSPTSLAISYAPSAARAGLHALLMLDDRLGEIVRSTREPLVGQMRLTWWHDALTRLGDVAAPPEPVLTALVTQVLPRGVAGTTLATMIEGWELLLGSDPLSDDDLLTYASGRGGTLFAAMAQLSGVKAVDPVAAAGEGWALADLARHVRDPALARRAAALAAPRLATSRGVRWSRAGRGIGALALLAAHTDAGPAMVARLFWHRLTGR